MHPVGARVKEIALMREHGIRNTGISACAPSGVACAVEHEVVCVGRSCSGGLWRRNGCIAKSWAVI